MCLWVCLGLHWPGSIVLYGSIWVISVRWHVVPNVIDCNNVIFVTILAILAVHQRTTWRQRVHLGFERVFFFDFSKVIGKIVQVEYTGSILFQIDHTYHSLEFGLPTPLKIMDRNTGETYATLLDHYWPELQDLWTNPLRMLKRSDNNDVSCSSILCTCMCMCLCARFVRTYVGCARWLQV